MSLLSVYKLANIQDLEIILNKPGSPLLLPFLEGHLCMLHSSTSLSPPDLDRSRLPAPQETEQLVHDVQGPCVGVVVVLLVVVVLNIYMDLETEFTNEKIMSQPATVTANHC